MADADLRRLERAAAQGDLGAGERLLRERLRRGRITADQVALAAWLGDPAALALRPERSASSDDDAAFVDGLAEWGRAVAVRGACAVARALPAPTGPDADGPPAPASLVVLQADGPTRPLAPGEAVIAGRAPHAALRIADPSVSREHCLLRREADGRVWVDDLGSRNGTWLGSDALGPAPTELHDGNFLRVGQTGIELRLPSARPGQAALDAVCAWLDAPTSTHAEAVERARSALGRRPRSRLDFEAAVHAAARAVLADPPRPGAALATAGPEVDLREAVRRALLPLALGDEPLPRAPDPPARLALAGRPQDDHAWRRIATTLEEDLGLRAQRWLPRFSGDADGPVLARAGDGALEEVTVIAAGGLPEETRARIVRVAALAEQRLHPRVARFLGCRDVARADGRRLVLRTGHVAGADLPGWLRRGLPEARRAVQALQDLCGAAEEALAYLPRPGLEPDTVRFGADGRASLVGAVATWARDAVDRELANLHVHPGDPGVVRLAYLSPEEATEARSVEPPTCAVYRLGALLFHALTGRPPFVPRSARVLLEILDLPPPVPSELRPGLSAELDAVVLRALEKDPAARDPDPLALQAALAETPEGLSSGAL